MRCCCGFAATAFEIHHRDYLDAFAFFAVRDVAARAFGAAV